MTRLFFAAVVTCCLLASQAFAQEPQRFDLYAGYSYVHTGDSISLNGADVAVSAHITKGLSVEGAISANFGTISGAGHFVDSSSFPATFPLETPFRVADYRGNVDQYLYLAGPKYTFRFGRVEPFVHALFGVAHRRIAADATILPDIADNPSIPAVFAFSGEQSDTSFAMSAGGGADVRLTKRIGLRAIQVDYVYTHFTKGYPDFAAVTQNNVKITAGLVFRF